MLCVVYCNGHPLDPMCTKSLLPRSIILALLSWSAAIWRFYLSSLTLFLCRVKFPLLSSLPPFFLLIPLSQLCPPLFEHTRMYSLCPACLPAADLSWPDLFHERERCWWAPHLSFFLPPSFSYFLFFVSALFNLPSWLSNQRSSSIFIRSERNIVEKWKELRRPVICSNVFISYHKKTRTSQLSVLGNYTSQCFFIANIQAAIWLQLWSEANVKAP